ncbi:MAG: hypothetical protein LQ350_008196 [Teloschistes chrysophthalmus]|nr:MAG: hypothetical protein LQ350_008196 [Niorma chrysophthalma]
MSPSTEPASGATASLIRIPIATPYWGEQGGQAFTVRAVAQIHATSAATIRQSLLNVSAYPEWNNFVPRVAFPKAPTSDSPQSNGSLREGTLFTEHVDMFGNGKPSGLVRMRLLMTMLEETEHENGKGYKVVWLGKGYPDWALRSERVHAIYPNGDGTCTYDVWETFSGPLALLVRLFVGSALVKRFRQWNQELKEYVERKPEDTGP